MTRLLLGLALSAIAFALCVSPAHAEMSGQRRPFDVPGRADNQPVPEPGVNAEVPLVAPAEPQRSPDRQGEDASERVAIERIEVTGNSVFAPDELASIVAPYERRPLGIEDISQLRLDLSEHYLREGYINSGVIVPQQDLASGRLRLEAIEGALDEIRVEGNEQLRPFYVKQRIAQRVSTPLNISELRDALTILQDDPNIARLDARLAPNERLGGAVLNLNVEPASRFDLTVGTDNHRATTIGEGRVFAAIEARNVTGFGERWSLYGSTASGGNSLNIGLNFPVAPRFSLQLYYGESDAEVIEQQLQDLDIASTFDVWGAGMELRLVDGLRGGLSLSFGWEEKNTESFIGGDPFILSPGAIDGVSRTRSLVAGADFSLRRATYAVSLRATYRHGLGVAGATEFNPAPNDLLAQLSNPTEADGRYELWLYQGVLVRRLNSFPELAGLNDRAQIVLRATLQRASDPLMSLEKIAIGGANSVRGFRENLLVRDSGSAVSLELQLPIPGFTVAPGLRHLIATPFVDYGRAFDLADSTALFSEGASSRDQIVTSIGVGLLWQPAQNLFFNVQWAEGSAKRVPVQILEQSDGNALQARGIHASIQYKYVF